MSGPSTVTLKLYPTLGKVKAKKLCVALAEGVQAAGDRAEIVPAGSASKLERGAAFFYGMDPYTLPLLRQAETEGRNWYYADNAYYFGRGEYFRVTHRALMHDGTGDAPPDRWRSFDINLRPWRGGGRYIVVTSQSRLFYTSRMGMDRDEWYRRVVQLLKKYTDRPIIPCMKPEPRQMRNDQPHSDDFEQMLKSAYCVVTESSSTGVGAVIQGIPVVSLGPSMCTPMATPVTDIEAPRKPDREQWLQNLAANQWTKDELRDGTAWRMLQAQPIPFIGQARPHQEMMV